MKKYDEKTEENDNLNNWPLNAADKDQGDKDLEKEEDVEEESGDWGDVDPAGGPTPSAPGSAV